LINACGPWVKLSRKHAINVNPHDQHLSIFGGKLTDCLNVGNEVTSIIRGFAIDTPYPEKKWSGELGEYLRGEIELSGRREMITKLEDFLRRRSKISLVVRDADLATAPGLKEACKIFFGDEADAKLDEYLQSIEQQ